MENMTENNYSDTGTQVNSPYNTTIKRLGQAHKANKPQSYMPFLFKNKAYEINQKSNSPAPGQYIVKSIFQQKDKRDSLFQKYRIEMQNTKKIKQSVVFKSSAKRFNYKQQPDSIPISYSYQTQNKTQKKFRKLCYKSLTNLNDNKYYPSIPDTSLKFGYSLGDEGHLLKINKTEDQINKQKQAMKNYVKKKLNAQNICCNKSIYQRKDIQRQNKKQIIQKIKTKINQRLVTQNSCVNEKSKCNKQYFKRIMKSLVKQNNYKCNESKVKQILKQKKNQIANLGPGSYDISLNNYRVSQKPQRFQFFNSTSERFSQAYNVETKQKVSDLVKKIEIQNKIDILRKTKSSDIWKKLKRPQRVSDKSQNSQKKCVQPGPGDYSPKQILTKVKIAKISPFNKSVRFQKGQYQQKQELADKFICLKMKKEKPRLICKIEQNGKLNINVKFKQRKQNSGEYQKLRNRQAYNSQYSICSWQNRPISRIETFPSALKNQY